MLKPGLLLLVVFSCGFLMSESAEAQLFPGRSGARPYPETLLLLRPRVLPIPRTEASAQGWYPYVIARAEDRDWIRETPIELRPNRPLHFWGNSRRRARR